MTKNERKKAKNIKKSPYNKNKTYAAEKEETKYIKTEKEEIFIQEKLQPEEINELLNKFEKKNKSKYDFLKTFPKEIKEEI